MLRFVNPAIVTPQAYMLVEGAPKPNPRRTLTLVDKLITKGCQATSKSRQQGQSCQGDVYDCFESFRRAQRTEI
jgi:GTPase-activator protein for Ras-like GTPase